MLFPTAPGTILAAVRLRAMGQDSQRYRDRARDCLNISKSTRHQADRIILEEMAAELDAEAKRLEREEAGEDEMLGITGKPAF